MTSCQPPGPPSNIFFGTPNFQDHQPHHWYRQLSLQYGPIVSVWKGATLQVILNSAADIKELCDKVFDIVTSYWIATKSYMTLSVEKSTVTGLRWFSMRRSLVASSSLHVAIMRFDMLLLITAIMLTDVGIVSYGASKGRYSRLLPEDNRSKTFSRSNTTKPNSGCVT